jgi:threonine dehydrogenase-like Zn-dependent dehydrogenase
MIGEQMRRFELVDRRTIELKTNVPVPEPAAGQVLVNVKACTVCGRSDLVYYHYLGLRDHCAQGCFGHEIAGIVAAVGPGVTRVKPADRVFVRTPLSSGYAEYALAREIAVGRLPAHVPFEQGAILQLLPLAIHATRGIRLGDRVLIVGQGPVGLMALQMARLRGAAFVTVSDLDAWRLARSSLLHADAVLAVAGPPTDAPPAGIANQVFDVAIDAVGTPSTVQTCINAVRDNGLVVLLGTHHVDTTVPLDLVQWEKKSLRVHSSAEPDDEVRRAALATAERLVERNRVAIEPLLTHTYPLERLQDAIDHLTQSSILHSESGPRPVDGPPPQTLKVAICP